MARTNRTPKKRRDWRPTFLRVFAAGGDVSKACAAAKVARSTVYDARKREPEFAQAWADAEEAGSDQLEAEAVRRAMDGSDVLLIFLLKCRRPGVYRDRQAIEHSGPGGGPVAVTIADLKAAAAKRRAALVAPATNGVHANGHANGRS